MGLSRANKRAYTKTRQNPGVTPGQRIRAERKAKGISQEALAKIAGIRQPSLSQIETGNTKELKGRTLWGMARALGVTTGWIMTGKGQKEADKRLSDQEEELLGIFEALTDEARLAILAAARVLPKSPEDGEL